MNGLEKIRRSVKPWKNHLLDFRNKGKASEMLYSKKHLKRVNARRIRYTPILDDEALLDVLVRFFPRERNPFRFKHLFF